jgi:hypothetical protein
VVSGRAGADTRLVVTADGHKASADAGLDGAWSVDFAGEVDLRPGTPVTVEAIQPSGYHTLFTVPVFRVSAQIAADRVVIEGPPGLQATVEVERGGATIGSGACRVTIDACDALLADAEGRPVFTVQGDTVLAFPSEGTTAVLDLPRLTAHIDPTGRDVVGEAPVGVPISIAFDRDRGLTTPGNAATATDANGVYDYELGTSEWELLAPGVAANVYATLPERHRVFARAVLEVVRATPGMARVTGLAEPGTIVTATLWRSDREAGSATAEVPGSGAYNLDLIMPDGGARPVEAGDRLAIIDSRGRRELTMTAGAAWTLGADLAVGGFGPADARVSLASDLTDAGVERATTQTALSNQDGAFYIPGVLAAPSTVRSQAAIVEVGRDAEIVLPVVRAGPRRVYLPAAHARSAR